MGRRRVPAALPSDRAPEQPDGPRRDINPLRDQGQMHSMRPATDAERARVAVLAADHALGTDDPRATTRLLVDVLGLRQGARRVRGV
ncbi:hypothetical protein AB0B27_31100 [Micromonospora rifamycinica]|uniref:hypothetical protein n=1 Tax=Micromonospora rifamycinica TaxID=291594 RepID=UPI0033FF0F7D